MTIGVYTFEIHLPMAESLKDRRQVVRRLKDRLRARHNVAVGEVADHSELWQRAALVVVSVASGRDPLERLFEAVYREAEALVPGTVFETGRDFLDAIESGFGESDLEESR
jgi:uncharacterized protein YlxP (DUF503 family)